MKQLSKNCKRIQKLLFRSALGENLSDRERELVANHLKECSHCIAYKEIMEQTDWLLDVSQSTELTPDPQIKSQIVHLLKAKKSQSGATPAKYLRKWKENIKKAAQYRIPVYQAAIVLMLFIVIFAGLFQTGFQGNDPVSRTSSESVYDSLALFRVDASL
ncbi:MAG: zf-HC2 domain-containing protein, partial [Calditrichaeota bacterium]